MSAIRSLSKDTLIYGAGSVVQKIIGLALLPLYTRALLPTQYGILDTLAVMTFLLSSIFGLGISGATNRYFFIAEGEEEKRKLLYTSAIIRSFSYSVPLLILVIFSSKISLILFDSDKYSLVLIATGFLLFFSSQQEVQSQIFRIYRESLKYNLVVIIKAIIYPVFGILLVVLLKWGVLGATIASVITSGITLVFSYFYFIRKQYIRQFSLKWAKVMLKFGFPLIFFSILSWVNSASDRIFLLHFKNLEQIGLYSIGNTFSQPVTLINSALLMSAPVLIYSLYGEEKIEEKPKTKLFLTKIWYTYLAVAVSAASFVSIFSYDSGQIHNYSGIYRRNISNTIFALQSNILYEFRIKLQRYDLERTK